MRLQILLALPVVLARHAWDHRCRYDQCAQQAQQEKLGACPSLFHAKTTSVKTVHTTSIKTVYQTDTTVLVAPITSMRTNTITQTATSTSTTITSITQTIPSTTSLTIDSTEIDSITEFETVTLQLTETDTATNVLTLTTTVLGPAQKRDDSKQSMPTLINPHFALMPLNAAVANVIAARGVKCPERCPNMASFSSACSCLGFKAQQPAASCSTTTITSIATSTIKSTRTIQSDSVAYVTTTLTFSSTVVNTETITSSFTTQTPVTQFDTSFTTATTVIEETATATEINTEFVTISQTATVTNTCTPTGYRLQIASPAAQAGIWLSADYRINLATTDVSSATIFTIVTSDSNKLQIPNGQQSDYDFNYNPSPIWFDNVSTINAQVAAGTWSYITCAVDTSVPAPYPFSCQARDKNIIQVQGSLVYLYQSVASGKTQVEVVAYPTC
ncbi:hypothetical protein Slin15195_G000010 [Septoria linicola]|uniref:Uncharacterized protein n=1 Tax=Septoria linicola TaxID=215465 RepID=A0A9Q9EEN4_9PEZI|nr:hypothetical protein Slin15195_G000010 [Septoria linicola]